MVKISSYKLSRQGKNSFSVSLPPLWVKDHHLSPGDALDFYRTDEGHLFLTGKPEEPRETQALGSPEGNERALSVFLSESSKSEDEDEPKAEDTDDSEDSPSSFASATDFISPPKRPKRSRKQKEQTP